MQEKVDNNAREEIWRGDVLERSSKGYYDPEPEQVCNERKKKESERR